MWKSGFYKPLGFLFLGLAILGAVLPILPSTPFLLLSAWFFARSSEKWHRWLLESELFGPMLRNWEDNRCISIRTKVFAVLSMATVGSATVFLVLDDLTIRLITAGLMAIGAATILTLKTCPGANSAAETTNANQN